MKFCVLCYKVGFFAVIQTQKTGICIAFRIKSKYKSCINNVLLLLKAII